MTLLKKSFILTMITLRCHGLTKYIQLLLFHSHKIAKRIDSTGENIKILTVITLRCHGLAKYIQLLLFHSHKIAKRKTVSGEILKFSR